MRAGSLRHRISIEQKQHNRDSIGGESEDVWTEFTPAFAEIKPIKGSEFISAASTQNKVTHRVIVRYFEGILPEMRVKHGVRYFNIVAVRNFFEQNKTIELMCEELI